MSERSGIGHSTVEEGQDLDEFEFEPGAWFARATPGAHPEEDDPEKWLVVAREFHYSVSWVRDRDNVPTLDHHMIYVLRSRELEDVRVNQWDLQVEWREVEPPEEEQEAEA